MHSGLSPNRHNVITEHENLLGLIERHMSQKEEISKRINQILQVKKSKIGVITYKYEF